MPGYVEKQLTKYRHKAPKRKQYCPYEPNPIKYGKQSNEIKQEPESPALGKEEKKYIHQVIGSFLYYARAVDMTILQALSEIAAQQSKPTEKTMQRVKQFLDYMHTNPNATIRYYAPDMICLLYTSPSPRDRG